jgi:DNA-binding NarL/FixJ family response regulator
MVVEDQAEVRAGLQEVLDSAPGFRCAGSFPNAEALLARIRSDRPDIVLMDIGLPGMNGIEATRQIRSGPRPPQIMMLTVYEDEARIFESLKAGATGYVLKSTPPDELLAAIRALHRGGSPMSSSIARRVVEVFHRNPVEPDPAGELTGREREILELLVNGFRYKEIGQRLGISLDTVRTHIRHIYEKMQVRSRTEATARYLRWEGGNPGST